MNENPYKSPTFVERRPEGRRRMRVAGTLLVVLAAFVWLPMTLGCIISAIKFPEKDLWIKLGAGLFNGCVAFVLQWGGRRLCRGRIDKPQAPLEQSTD